MNLFSECGLFIDFETVKKFIEKGGSDVKTDSMILFSIYQKM